MTQAELALAKLQGVSTLLRKEANKYCWWSKLKGNIKIEGAIQNNDLNLTFSESPIEVNNQLSIQGFGNTMILPTKKEYTGIAKFGDDVVKGKEEEAGYTWTQIHYNQIRHAVNIRKGEQQELVEAAFNAAQQEMPALARFFAKTENWNATMSVYEGLSENLSASQNLDGLGLPKRLHPNFYFVSGATGTGSITKVTTTANVFTTVSDLDTDANTVAGSSATPYILDTAVLENLQYICMDKNIAPIVTHGGNAFWLLIVHPMQAAYLRKDAAWLAAQREAINLVNDVAKNPIFNGTIGFYAGFAVQVDPTIIRGWNGYGTAYDDFLGVNPYGDAEDLYTATRKYNRRFMPQKTSHQNRCAIVLGKSALGLVERRTLSFRADDDDYGNIKGIAGVHNYGYARLDQVDLTQLAYLSASALISSVNTVSNDGSLVLMSYTPASNV